MMMEGFLAVGFEISGAVDTFLLLDSRSVKVDPFLARGFPSGAVYAFGF